jgi:hypothetical protein
LDSKCISQSARDSRNFTLRRVVDSGIGSRRIGSSQ